MRPSLVRLALTLALTLIAAPACGDDPPGPGNGTRREADLRVLFIGNSLTYYNDLPGVVQALADSAGGSLDVRAVVAGGFALEDHWTLGNEARDAIDQGDWDVVVLQQGPSSLESSRENLRQWTAVFAERIRAAGGRPALYMVWPDSQFFHTFDRSVESYTLAAQDVNGALFPVGEAWRAAWRRNDRAPLYGPDKFHPSAAGSYLAALVMVGMLYDRSPVGLPRAVRTRGGDVVGVGPQLARTLQEAAREAIVQYGRR